MKTQLTNVKKFMLEHADDIALFSLFTVAGVTCFAYGYDLGKRKAAYDLAVVAARDFVNNETGEVSELYMYHRNGAVSVLGTRLNK